MRYRNHPTTKDKISEIGLGSAQLPEAGMEEGVKALRLAVEGGINYYDLAAGNPAAFPIYGEALQDVRSQIFYQIHFGADYTTGSYGWTLDLDTVKRSIHKQLTELHTDYIDYGFIHCQDEFADWETFRNNGIYRYIQELQAQGVVRHIGLSSHTPEVIQKILDEVHIDMLMFSINPAYDYGEGAYAHGGVDERAKLYRRCEAERIGITVMKPFSGGRLLGAARSPFGAALTREQCIRYCLDKPGVLTVLPGAETAADIPQLLAYYDAPEEALDYSVIGSFALPEADGKCVYCGHCKPCPMGIEIDLVNKYYDLAVLGDKLAAEHYRTLEKNASDCIACGHCDGRCPFHVDQSGRMAEIRDFFG